MTARARCNHLLLWLTGILGAMSLGPPRTGGLGCKLVHTTTHTTPLPIQHRFLSTPQFQLDSSHQCHFYSFPCPPACIGCCTHQHHGNDITPRQHSFFARDTPCDGLHGELFHISLFCAGPAHFSAGLHTGTPSPASHTVHQLYKGQGAVTERSVLLSAKTGCACFPQHLPHGAADGTCGGGLQQRGA